MYCYCDNGRDHVGINATLQFQILNNTLLPAEVFINYGGGAAGAGGTARRLVGIGEATIFGVPSEAEYYVLGVHQDFGGGDYQGVIGPVECGIGLYRGDISELKIPDVGEIGFFRVGDIQQQQNCRYQKNAPGQLGDQLRDRLIFNPDRSNVPARNPIDEERRRALEDQLRNRFGGGGPAPIPMPGNALDPDLIDRINRGLGGGGPVPAPFVPPSPAPPIPAPPFVPNPGGFIPIPPPPPNF